MLPMPKKVKLVVGAGEGPTQLNAFDAALLAAGIGNLNLLKVSSILPPACMYEESFAIPPGSLTPTAYGSVMSDQPQAEIAAAIGLGFCANDYGVIMEYDGPGDRANAEATVAAMVRHAFAVRQKALLELRVLGIAHRVEHHGAVVAAAVLWY